MARRTLTKAGRARRNYRQKVLGIKDIRKATKAQKRAARKLGALGNTKAARKAGRGGRAFNAAKHPRRGKGTGGGQFIKAGGTRDKKRTNARGTRKGGARSVKGKQR